MRDLGDLVDRYFASRFSLLSVSDNIDTRTAAGRLVLNVLTSVAQWEREATGERTRDALFHLRAGGVRLGGAALGWRRSVECDEEGRRRVEPVESEAYVLARMIALRRSGYSLRRIASVLSSEGHRTKRGGAWASETVRKVLVRANALEVTGDHLV